MLFAIFTVSGQHCAGGGGGGRDGNVLPGVGIFRNSQKKRPKSIPTVLQLIVVSHRLID